MMELLGLNGGILAQASSEMMENFEPSEGLLAGDGVPGDVVLRLRLGRAPVA